MNNVLMIMSVTKAVAPFTFKALARQTFSVYMTVIDSWYIKQEVYEETFDSQSMDKETFEAKLKARLNSYNDNLDPKDEIMERSISLAVMPLVLHDGR